MLTIILTTHYIEEAEAIADRVGVINQGEIIVVEEKKELLKKMGQKTLTIELQDEIIKIPDTLEKYNLKFCEKQNVINLYLQSSRKANWYYKFITRFKDAGFKLRDLKTEQSNLEKIFVSLVKENNEI